MPLLVKEIIMLPKQYGNTEIHVNDVQAEGLQQWQHVKKIRLRNTRKRAVRGS